MMGLTNTAGAHGFFGAVAWTRRLCENARQIQAANWRAASSFPLVNYLPVAPVHEPRCQLVNHVALVQLDSVDTEPMGACNEECRLNGGTGWSEIREKGIGPESHHEAPAPDSRRVRGRAAFWVAGRAKT
jgi:hypothetical protein